MGPMEVVTAALAAALVAGPGLVPPAPVAGATGAAVASPAQDPGATACPAPTPSPLPASTPVPVRMPPARTFSVGAIPASMWKSPPVKDPTWQMRFYALEFLAPVARRAQQEGKTRVVSGVLSQVDSFYRLNPDKGTNARGWDEGTSLRRLNTLTCLHALTGSSRIEAHMAKEVGVLSGWRYYGPPRHQVHNHGLMANMAMARAGQRVGRGDWVALARRRMAAEAPMAFTASGTSTEQSSYYHKVNASMWRSAAGELERLSPGDPAARAIRSRLVRADAVTSWLTAPDGDLVQVGDGGRTEGRPVPAWQTGVLRDDAAGLLVGRWDARSADASHYTLRYGPARSAHGHHDKGGLTWSTRGTRVLVGPGHFSYDWTDPMAARARGPQAHNVSWPVGAALDARASARLRFVSSTPTSSTWRVEDATWGRGRSRTVTVDDAASRLVVVDSYPRGTKVQAAWHLDPSWSYVRTSGRTSVYRHPTGRRLEVSTSGGFVSTKKGSRSPLAGWHHDAPGSAVPGYEIRTQATTTLRTVLTVRR